MNKTVNYLDDVVRERTAGGPFLLEGEQLRYEARVAFSPNHFIVAFVLMFMPPLFVLFSAMWLGGAWLVTRSARIWVTDKRIVESEKALPWSSNYGVSSMPLKRISQVRRTMRYGFQAGILDGIFGIGDIEVLTSDKLLPQLLMVNVRKPRDLMKAIKEAASEVVTDE